MLLQALDMLQFRLVLPPLQSLTSLCCCIIGLPSFSYAMSSSKFCSLSEFPLSGASPQALYLCPTVVFPCYLPFPVVLLSEFSLASLCFHASGPSGRCLEQQRLAFSAKTRLRRTSSKRIKLRSKSGQKGVQNRVGVSGVWGWGSSGRSGSVAPSKSCKSRSLQLFPPELDRVLSNLSHRTPPF